MPLALRTRELIARAGGVARASAARRSRGGTPVRRDRLRRARSGQPVAPGADAGPGAAGGADARVGAVDRPRAARHLSRLHRRPARALRRGAAARAPARRARQGVPGSDRDVQEVTRPVALALGTLLHDVGKPYGSPHSEIGAGLAVASAGGWDRGAGHPAGGVPGPPAPGDGADVAAARSGRPRDDLRLRRLCGDEESLRELYLLTFCDLASVAPDAMSSWKETLLGGALHPHADVPAPRRRPARLRARGDRRRAAGGGGAAARRGGSEGAGAGDAVRRLSGPLLRRERRGPHRLSRAA